jgi:protein-disulfide isomerase
MAKSFNIKNQGDLMSKRQELRDKHRRQQKQQRLIIIIMVIAGALLLAAALIYPSLKPVGPLTEVTPRVFDSPVSMNTLGNPDAPVKVDVWEDFQCPACKQYSEQIEPQIIKNYVDTGKVFYTFHHYPFIDSQVTTKESNQAANASMCAGAQGRFWDYHDMLFSNWNGENQGSFSDKRLIAFADNLGLKMSEFNSCFSQNQFKAEIDKDFMDGKDQGVSGTPSVLVNGVHITPGYIPSYADLANAIDAALDGQ